MKNIKRSIFIVISGNIGVGKSTLTNELSEELGWKPVYEPVEKNPYLADFYANMQRWSFHSQMFYLTQRLEQHLQLFQDDQHVIQDRSIYEDAEVFAKNLYERGDLVKRDYLVYQKLYDSIRSVLTPPDLVIYLHAQPEILVERIASRGRSFESKITKTYLQQLQLLYEQWADDFSLCPLIKLITDNNNSSQTIDLVLRAADIIRTHFKM